MAPEIVFSTEYDEKVDVFSFAMIIFSCLEENYTIYGENLTFNLEFKVANDPSFRPQYKHSHLFPTQIIQLSKLCWSHESQNRPSFKQIVKILNNVKENLKQTQEKI